MIISLCCLLNYTRFRKRERVFNKGNKFILTQEEIKALANSGNTPRAIEAFESAVVSHAEVRYGNGKKILYTSYPREVAGLYLGAGHDGYRRAEIAYQIGKLSTSIRGESIDDAVSILEVLAKGAERKYTQILALNSLGIIGRRRISIFDNIAEDLKIEFNKPFCYPIGVLAFLEKIVDTSKREEIAQMLKEAQEKANTRNSLFLEYFMTRTHLKPKTPETSLTTNSLSLCFSEADLLRGLELTELVGPRPPFRKHTPQAQVYKHLADICLNLIGRAGYIDRLNFKAEHEPPFREKDSLIEKGYK